MQPQTLQQLAPTIAALFSGLVKLLMGLLKFPKDLPEEKMTPEEKDEYARERKMAAKTLCTAALTARAISFPFPMDDEDCEFLSANLHLYDARTVSALMIAVAPERQPLADLHRATLKRSVANLKELLSDLVLPVPVEQKPVRDATKLPPPDSRKRSNSDPVIGMFPAGRKYIYWVPEGKANVSKHAYCEMEKVMTVHVILRDLLVMLEVFPVGFEELWPDIEPLLKKAAEFPLATSIRRDAVLIISIHGKRKSETLDFLWDAACNGPRSFDTRYEPTIAKEAFVNAVFCERYFHTPAKISAADMLKLCFADESDAAAMQQTETLDSLSPWQYEIGQLPAWLTPYISIVCDLLINSKPGRKANHSLLNTLTDYIKRGAGQLKPHAAKITAALNTVCEHPGFELAVYSLGLWIGKYIQGKFGTNLDVIVLFSLCRDASLRCLNRMVGDPVAYREVSLPIYTLTRVCTFGFASSDPSICQDLPELIIEHAPLRRALEGDVIAFSTNEYICDVIADYQQANGLVPFPDAFRKKVLKFYYELLKTPELTEERVGHNLLSNPGVMAQIAQIAAEEEAKAKE